MATDASGHREAQQGDRVSASAGELGGESSGLRGCGEGDGGEDGEDLGEAGGSGDGEAFLRAADALGRLGAEYQVCQEQNAGLRACIDGLEDRITDGAQQRDYLAGRVDRLDKCLQGAEREVLRLKDDNARLRLALQSGKRYEVAAYALLGAATIAHVLRSIL